MSGKSIDGGSLTSIVPVRKKTFWLFCSLGLLMVSFGVFSLKLERTINATGVVMANVERYILAPANGAIVAHYARIGDHVEAGDPLFSMETYMLDLAILERSRDLLTAESDLEATEWALRELEIRPGDAATLTAEARGEVLRRIREIQEDVLAAWDRLEMERAVRALEYNQQRIAALRTEIEELEALALSGWARDGLLSLSQERLRSQHAGLLRLCETLREEIALLHRQREALTVRSPLRGTVIDIYRRYPGMAVQEGEVVLRIVDMESGQRIRAFVGERNIDLLREGSRARMESQVFDSLFEGYVFGGVQRIIRGTRRQLEDAGAAEPRYEVTIEVEETPYPLVLGSTVRIEFLLGRQSLFATLTQRRPGRPVPDQQPDHEQQDGEAKSSQAALP